MIQKSVSLNEESDFENNELNIFVVQALLYAILEFLMISFVDRK